MQEEKKKLENEKRKLKAEQENLARLSTSIGEKVQLKILKKVKVTTKGHPLRVRADPSSKSEVVVQIPTATIVPMLQETGQWYQIEYMPGKNGWISKYYSRMVNYAPNVEKKNLLEEL
jgi:hypothetical protein